MKAILLKSNGGVENLHLAKIDKPTPDKNEILIQTKAISINRVDVFVRQHRFALGAFMKPLPNQETFILGWDLSGIVTKTGENVTAFKVGDEVFGVINFHGQGRTYAEYIAAPASEIVIKPSNISHAEAAAACFACLTAWQSLVTFGKVKSGDKVLIHSAAGGVGHYAVQIAKHFGAYVVGTGSIGSKRFIMTMGADEFLYYQNVPFEEIINDADIVLDSQQGSHIERSISATKPGGIIIALLNMLNDEETLQQLKEKNIYAHKITVAPNKNDMINIAKLLEQGVIKSNTSQKFKLEEIAIAHDQIETGKTKGKIVIEF